MAEFAPQPPAIDTTTPQKLDESPIPSATAPPANGGTLENSIPVQKIVDNSIPVQKDVVVDNSVPVQKSVVVDNSIPAQKDVVVDTPPPSVKPTKTSTTTTTTTTTSSTSSSTGKKSSFVYSSPKISFEDDPPAYLKTKVESLIYWEYPKKSASFLVGSLAILILTQYYSLLQILAGVFTLATGLNWVFVNTHKQGQRFISGKSSENITNPHSGRLQIKGTYIPRDRVVRFAQLTVDVIEVITQQVTKLVLIEDNWRSAISLVVSYLVWTLAKFVSTKYLVGFFLVSAFTIPRLYLQNQEVVDAHVAQQSKNARVLAEKYGGVASAKAKELSQQARSFIKSKTSAVPAPTKKTE